MDHRHRILDPVVHLSQHQLTLLLSGLDPVDVGAASIPADDPALRIADRDAVGEVPAPLAVRPAQPEFGAERLARRGTLVLAHRGTALGSIAENTSAAITAALASGADMVEIDVTAAR